MILPFLNWANKKSALTSPHAFSLLVLGKGGGSEGKETLPRTLVSHPPACTEPTRLNTEGHLFVSIRSFFLRVHISSCISGPAFKKRLGFGIWICCDCKKEMWDQPVVLFIQFWLLSGSVITFVSEGYSLVLAEHEHGWL